MAEKNLITQARLQEVKFAQSGLVDNLAAHANASLSKAHGIILYYLPHPFLDGNGNDISVYKDSHGDRVGYYVMRLTYNNTDYYAPLELSNLPGKDPFTGISPDTNIGVVTPIHPGGGAWVTDFTPEDEQDLIVTNDDVLYPHTLLPHWETHDAGVYQIIPTNTFDSAGHKVGSYVARIVVDGVEYRIPCDLRVNGPIQPIRVAFPAINTGKGTNWNFCSMGRDDDQFGIFYYNLPTGGELPYSFIFQYNDYRPVKTNHKFTLDPLTGSGAWHDMPVTTVYTLMTAQPWMTAHYKYDTVDPTKMTIKASSGNDSQSVCSTIRGKYTNAAGSTYTNWCIFVCNDEDGCGFIADPDFNQAAYHTAIRNDPVWTDGYYTPPGPP